MLKFESWPPELGKVKLTSEAITNVSHGVFNATDLGRFVAATLAENSDWSSAMDIVQDLARQLPFDSGTVEAFRGPATSYLNRFPNAQLEAARRLQ